MSHHDDRPKIVAIIGTNASGKSDLAIHLARAFGGEIVSADSRQIYKGLYLCSGKLRPSEQQGIPHHLLDVTQVGDEFSLAHYQRLSYRAIDDVLSRNHFPLLVGGTGLYVQAIVDGYELVEAPPDQQLRAELESKSLAELVTLLKSENPTTAARIELHNRRRIIRALEIHRRGFQYSATRTKRPRYQAILLGITWPRPVLLERIRHRLQRRLDQGMIEEVRDLLDTGVPPKAIDDLGLEYRHILRYLLGEYKTREELFENLRIAIGQFAKRQLAWFKRDPRIIWLDTSGDYVDEAKERVRVWMQSPS